MADDTPVTLQDLVDLAARLQQGAVIEPDELLGIELDHFAQRVIGLRWDALSDGQALAHVDCGAEHQQPLGMVHGGIWSSVAESLSSYGGAVRAARRGKAVVGVENTARFLRPHASGRADIDARLIHEDDEYQLWDTVITRSTDGEELARCQVRLAHVDWPPVSR